MEKKLVQAQAESLTETESQPLSLEEIASQIPDSEKISRLKHVVEQFSGNMPTMVKPLVTSSLPSLFQRLDSGETKIDDLLSQAYGILDFILFGEEAE